MVERVDFFSIDNETERVRRLQLWLREIGRRDTRIPEVFIDGIYGEKTRQAVRKYQETRVLPVTGEIDRVTFDRIFAEYSDFDGMENTLGYAPAFDKFEGGRISEGDVFEDIYLLQLLFRRLAVKDARFFLEMTGVYDEDTAAAVTLLRSISGNGEGAFVDTALWNSLIRLTESIEGYV